jgi:DNA-nicking Smr family endonuclease
VEKVSSALLLVGEGPSDYYLGQESTTKEKVDQNHFGVKLILKQLNELYPAVNNDQLYDVLQSTNFDVRDAAAVVEAGLTPDPEQTQRTVNSKVEQMSFSQTLLKNIHNASGETSISSTNQSQQASSTDNCPPNTIPKQKWAVVASKESHPDKCDAERKNLLPQFKPCGDLDDYNCQRQSAKENWQKMKHCLREAAVAHGRGQGSRAGILAEKGKQYKQLAQQADERASQQIFHHRNKDIVNNITIDLHAQHVKEAIQVLKLHLRSLSSISSVHTLTVITGYGSHSNAGQAKIKPAVMRFLTKSGIPWKELNIGCLIVKMSDACKELYKGDDVSSS